jgi:hypothetical protein
VPGAAAAELLEADERDEVQLLKDVVLISDREQPISGFIGSSELVKHLTELDSRPWSDWPHGFTMHKLAKLLRRLGIHPENPFGSNKRGYGQKAIRAVLGPARHSHSGRDVGQRRTGRGARPLAQRAGSVSV